jgi:hypothetical protein
MCNNINATYENVLTLNNTLTLFLIRLPVAIHMSGSFGPEEPLIHSLFRIEFCQRQSINFKH